MIKQILLLIILWIDLFAVKAQKIITENFHSNQHPRIFVTSEDRSKILEKIQTVSWAQTIVENLHAEIDPLIQIHQTAPGYIISRMQMHWEPGKRYTHFYTDGNRIPKREGNAKYPTIRITYGRAASNSVSLPPLEKMIPYSNGEIPKKKATNTFVKYPVPAYDPAYAIHNLGEDWEIALFEETGLGVETIHRTFSHWAWKSSILYYLTKEKKYAKLAADILWTFVRGAAQQEQVNPHQEGGIHGFLSFETLGDTRHFSTLPLAYDMIYTYLHQEYFELNQFTQGIKGEMWAPPHPEGKEWAMVCFETMFKKLIDNKLSRGGALHGNWNTNEHQSAMLYALALENDDHYKDNKGREYYVNQLIYGPTTDTHGAYVDVLRANISPTTGLWPEAPAGYGQGSTAQLVCFGYIYYKNGIDLLSDDPLLQKAAMAMPQMLFPNGYVTNFGDASYSRMNVELIELMLAYADEKGNEKMKQQLASLMAFNPERNLNNEFYYSLLFYLPEIPYTPDSPTLSRTSYSEVYSLIFERNMATDYRNALAFAVSGFGKETGHRQPNGLNLELYGRGHILAPDQGIGQDYWSKDTHEYKVNVAAHNTVSPNGKGADNNIPQNLRIMYAEPAVIDGGEPETQLSPDHQYIEVYNHFHTTEIKADQRRLLSIIRTSPQNGYYVDIFRSNVTDGDNKYHDYIYHNMGTAFECFDTGRQPLAMTPEPLDTLSGKGYMFFDTLGSLQTEDSFSADFHLGIDDTHMRMFMVGNKKRTLYKLNSLFNHRYYIPELRYIPVPAILVRQEGEAFNNPFVAIYEPYGNGTTASIESVSQKENNQLPGTVTFTVQHTDGRTDHILHSTSPQGEMMYQGITFRGVYAVISYHRKNLVSVYIGSGTYLKTKEIEIHPKDNNPFDAYFKIENGIIINSSNNNLKITTLETI